MAISFHVEQASFPIGTADFLNCFFSTVNVRLEEGRPGSRFPCLMRELYAGTLSPSLANAAVRELANIREELARLPPWQVVWDDEDSSRQPPWGSEIAPSVSSLANYFLTSEGKPLLEVIQAALELSVTTGRPIEIR
jgi:hypothetical protein